MIERLLRLFSRYRAAQQEIDRLREDLRETADARRELQVESHERQQEIERLREDLWEARAGERSAYQMMVNVSYQRQYGWTPFPESPHIPEHRVAKSAGGPIEESAVRAEEIYRRKMDQSKQEFQGLFDLPPQKATN